MMELKYMSGLPPRLREVLEALEAGEGVVTDGSISTAKLADNAVTAAKIVNGVVSLAKLDTATQNTINGKLTATKAATQADSTATDVAGLVTDFNALLAKLKAAGLMN
jgi:hypothetical protein